MYFLSIGAPNLDSLLQRSKRDYCSKCWQPQNGLCFSKKSIKCKLTIKRKHALAKKCNLHWTWIDFGEFKRTLPILTAKAEIRKEISVVEITEL